MFATDDELEEIMVIDHAKTMQQAKENMDELTKLRAPEAKGLNGDAKAMQGALGVQVGGSHYKDMAIQPIEFIERNQLSFSAGNVIKYICRADKKNGLEDLEKAKHYIELMIELRGK